MKIRLKEILWPHTCPLCGKVCAEKICASCKREADSLLIKEPRCMKCGKPVRCPEQEYCHDCAHMQHIYDRGVSLWLHKDPVDASIYRFKYRNQRFYAGFYAAEMVKNYGRMMKNWAPEVILAVPLHLRRRKKRGYNQSELLASEIGRLLNIPVVYNLVRRVRDTDPQKELDSRKRRKNLEKAFAAERFHRPLHSVLVIDDIYTTGNTIDAVAKALKETGVQKVYFLTISIGQGY